MLAIWEFHGHGQCPLPWVYGIIYVAGPNNSVQGLFRSVTGFKIVVVDVFIREMCTMLELAQKPRPSHQRPSTNLKIQRALHLWMDGWVLEM